jgi:virginiamycin A acetyltransferase
LFYWWWSENTPFTTSHKLFFDTSFFYRSGYFSNGIPNTEFKEADRCKIGNDVWIGENVLVKAGVSIGHGAIIGANSFVNKDIPPYAIAVGSPTKIIKYRFDEGIIKKLLELKWWDYSEELLKAIILKTINKPYTLSNPTTFIELLSNYKK